MRHNSIPLPKPWTTGTRASSLEIQDLLAKAKNLHQGASTQQTIGQDDPRRTVRYLTEYLNQLIMDNCSLKGQLENREKEVRWLQQELMKKQRQSEQLQEAKQQISQTVKRVSDYNSSYIQELKRKNAEIAELKQRLLEAPRLQMQMPRTDDSEVEEPKQRPKPRYKELREEIMGKKESNTSTVSGGSLLENAKRYIASIQSAVEKSVKPTARYSANYTHEVRRP